MVRRHRLIDVARPEGITDVPCRRALVPTRSPVGAGSGAGWLC
jgi:hypothetical protein